MPSQLKIISRLNLLGALLIGSIWIASSFAARTGHPQPQQEQKDQPYVIEYYYKAKWGHAEEFLALFKKNHYPVLKLSLIHI